MLRTALLGKPFAAEVLDVDLRQPIDPATAGDLVSAWQQYPVLAFRNQDISADDQRRLVTVLGGVHAPRWRPSYTPTQETDSFYVANVGEGKSQVNDGEMQFHADQCYYDTPARGAVLYGMEIPSKGGNTLFASAYAAYEALPQDLKARLQDLDVLFAYDYETTGGKERGPVGADAPRFTHPAVIKHPFTGRPVLFVNRLMAHSFVGLPGDESDALLLQLFDHIERSEWIYEHVWRKGDVVLWDNFATLHARTDFDPKERRVLRRMSIAGKRPEPWSGRRLAPSAP